MSDGENLEVIKRLLNTNFADEGPSEIWRRLFAAEQVGVSGAETIVIKKILSKFGDIFRVETRKDVGHMAGKILPGHID